jgi:hypothetical protein
MDMKIVTFKIQAKQKALRVLGIPTKAAVNDWLYVWYGWTQISDQ